MLKSEREILPVEVNLPHVRIVIGDDDLVDGLSRVEPQGLLNRIAGQPDRSFTGRQERLFLCCCCVILASVEERSVPNDPIRKNPKRDDAVREQQDKVPLCQGHAQRRRRRWRCLLGG